MQRNTEIKVTFASGYYDLICPFFDVQFTFYPNSNIGNVKMTYYEGRDMMYTQQPYFIKLSHDLQEF